MRIKFELHISKPRRLEPQLVVDHADLLKAPWLLEDKVPKKTNHPAQRCEHRVAEKDEKPMTVRFGRELNTTVVYNFGRDNGVLVLAAIIGKGEEVNKLLLEPNLEKKRPLDLQLNTSSIDLNLR